jgi:hypothetical protein
VHDPEPRDHPGRLLAARQRPGARHQRVDGVLAAEEEHRREESKGTEEPAYGISGWEAVGDDGAECGEAHRYDGVLGPLREDGHTWARLPAQDQQEQPAGREGQGEGAHVPRQPDGLARALATAFATAFATPIQPRPLPSLSPFAGPHVGPHVTNSPRAAHPSKTTVFVGNRPGLVSDGFSYPGRADPSLPVLR